MGACYIPGHYDEYRRLVREYGAGTLGAPADHARSIYSSEFGGPIREYEVGKYGEAVVAALIRVGSLRPASRIGRLLQLYGAMRRYIRLRRRLLGADTYPFAAMPAPAIAAELALPFVDLVRKHRLEVMLPLFRLVQSAQGYGVLEEIASFYVLLWNTPELVTEFIKSRLGINRRPLVEMRPTSSGTTSRRASRSNC